jgi:hypothetical protein
MERLKAGGSGRAKSSRESSSGCPYVRKVAAGAQEARIAAALVAVPAAALVKLAKEMKLAAKEKSR